MAALWAERKRKMHQAIEAEEQAKLDKLESTLRKWDDEVAVCSVLTSVRISRIIII